VENTCENIKRNVEGNAKYMSHILLADFE